MGSDKTQGPNHSRRLGPGLLLILAYPVLKLITFFLSRKHPVPGSHAGDPKTITGTTEAARESLIVYQDYQVGDFFMAMPAIKLLARYVDVTVVCRPDCLFILRDAGIAAVGLHNPFFARPGVATFWIAFRNAWALRGLIRGPALDLDADPRSALFLKAAGAGRTHAYARAFSWLFDATFPLPAGIRHQADKNLAVAEAYLHFCKLLPSSPANLSLASNPSLNAMTQPIRSEPRNLIVSCWTRKDEKNWPLENWDRIAAFLRERKIGARILVPPDGDREFNRFRKRWQDQLEFLNGDLEFIYHQVRASDGVICTDNFLGHMGAYLRKPVFWINGSSDPPHVAPQGSGTRIVQHDPMPCRPCGHRCVNPRYKSCLIDLRPERVANELEDWLAEKVFLTSA